MRRLKNTLLVLFTLLLVAAGAAMPEVTAYVQDSYGAGMQESRSFDSFSLTLRQDSETARILRRIASGNYWIEEAVDWTEELLEELAHTPQQTVEAAMDELERMVQCGVMDAGILENMGTPQIVLSAIRTDASLFALEDDIPGPAASLGEEPEEDVELIAYAWECWWPESDGFGPMVRIDDTTGKILLAMIPTPSQKYYMDFDKQEKGWALFLKDHYGFEIVNVSEQYYDGGDVRFAFFLDPEDGEGQLPIAVDINPLDNGYYSYVSPYAH